jgi:hypothetical protein
MKKKNYFLFGFWILLFTGIGLRIYNLNKTLGGGDENQYLLDYGNASFQHIATSFFYGGHHIFHTLVMRLMIVVFGDENAIAIRFPAFLCSLGALFIVYKISQSIFESKIIPLVSLAIMVFHPIQIYYSNVARGYSFIIFFSALMILAAIRIFESGKFGVWGWVFSFSAFLSTYTIATNVYFVFGLGCAIALIVFTPSLFNETRFNENESKKAFLGFLAIFIAAGLMTLLAYWPVLDSLTNEAKNYHLPKTVYSNSFQTVYELIKSFFKIILNGNLIFFIPFLVWGFLFGPVRKKSYRVFAICVLALPFFVPLTTNVGGYARNYLFNIPITVSFLAAGLVASGSWIEIKLKKPNPLLKHGFVVMFFFAAIWQIFWVYFPTFEKGFDLNNFRKDMKQLVNPLDLLIIPDPKHYWYSHNIYNQNLKRSIFLNKMSGIKILSKTEKKPTNKESNSLFFKHPIFKYFLKNNKISSNRIDRGLSIHYLNKKNVVSIIRKDFESHATWSAVRGNGEIDIEQNIKLVGNTSIKIKNKKNNEVFIVHADMNQKIQIRKPVFFVLLWGGLETNKNFRDYYLATPTPVLENTTTKERLAIPVTPINSGLPSYIDNKSQDEHSKWITYSFFGFFNPGEFNLKLQLSVLEGQTAIFDGIRLFLFEA